jgi:predicted ThiF/HesA family dinucleotide-utilizing enzyme
MVVVTAVSEVMADTAAILLVGAVLAISMAGASAMAVTQAILLIAVAGITLTSVVGITPTSVAIVAMSESTTPMVTITDATPITTITGAMPIMIITGATPITVGIVITAIMGMAGHTFLMAITEEGAAGYIVAP